MEGLTNPGLGVMVDNKSPKLPLRSQHPSPPTVSSSPSDFSSPTPPKAEVVSTIIILGSNQNLSLYQSVEKDVDTLFLVSTQSG